MAATDFATERLLTQVLERRAAGEPVALLTQVWRSGSAPRRVGAQMWVSAEDSNGMLSSGCVERALCELARECLQQGRSRMLRLGQQADYLDMSLPCGADVVIAITVNPARDWLEHILATLQARAPAQGYFDAQGNLLTNTETTAAVWQVCWTPPRRVLVLGDAAYVAALLRTLAVSELQGEGWVVGAAPTHVSAPVHVLRDWRGFSCPPLDARTAIVLMFHDHEWELPLLQQLLARQPAWLGALGSRRTQARRLALLRAAGLSEAECAQVRGPVGLDIGAASPAEIALSVVAEVIRDLPDTIEPPLPAE